MTTVQRPWLASYPAGIPAEIDPGQYRSVAALLEECCDRFRHRPGFANMGRTITYCDLDRLSATFAAFLVNDLKLVQGDRIAILLPHGTPYPVPIRAALRASTT